MRDVLSCRATPVRLTLIGAAAAGLLAGCSSSAPAKDTTSAPAPAPTSAATSAARPPTPKSTAASPPPSSSLPLSRFEADPAVQALRHWAVVAAKTVNTGHYRSAALDALTAREERKNLRYVLGGDVGLKYPGPIPFLPRSVSVPSTAERDIHACFLATGFAVDPKTHKPRKYAVLPTKVVMKLRGGAWLAAGFQDDELNCGGVKVPEVKW